MLHRKFAMEYIPKFINAVIKFFENAPDVEIRKIQKERFDRILLNILNLVRRVYTPLERFKITETFELSMYTLFIKSNYLQLRIDGIKGINDYCRNVEKGYARYFNEAALLKWFSSHQIVDELFSSRRHQQILQRSGQFLKFLYEKSAFTPKIVEDLWELSKDEQLRSDLFKILCEIGFPLHSSELNFFANKIANMDPNEITEDALDVIYEAYRNPNKTTEQLLKYANIISQIAFNEKCSIEISERALTKYAEMISVLEYDPYRKEILIKCVNEMLGKNQNSILAIKLLLKLLAQFIGSSISSTDIPITRANVIQFLADNVKIIEVLFANFENYLNQAKMLSKTNPNFTVEKYSHAINLQERIDFLGYILTNCAPTFKLKIEFYYKLWDILHENSVFPNDTIILFNFLKTISSDIVIVFFDLIIKLTKSMYAILV